jgi:hypothetical protein
VNTKFNLILAYFVKYLGWNKFRFIFRVIFALLLPVIWIKTYLFPVRSVLYVGHMYYYPWYLSRALRRLGWKADVLNWDSSTGPQIYYHGEDFKFKHTTVIDLLDQIIFYIKAIFIYDIFHFSNAHGISFSYSLTTLLDNRNNENYIIHYLKKSGKKIVYSHNACFDGVSQSSFSKWGPESVCSICSWRDKPDVCSDQKNLEWGRFRNFVADYQCTLGGNRVDCNDFPTIHEVPEFYCQSPEIWSPNLAIPDEFKISKKSENTVILYHGIGNKESRTNEAGVNIHTSHIYFPLIENFIREGMDLEVISPTGVPNMNVRYIQAQSDIFLDMLTYGWFGAMAREAMMLGKPVICYLRPEWLESMRQEIPEYVDELPIISATPQTIESVLRDLIIDKEKRLAIGRKSLDFALKWHSTDAAGHRFDGIYKKLLGVS